MKRAALCLAAISVVSCIVFYFFGTFYTAIFGAAIWITAALCFIFRKRFNSSKLISFVLAVSALFCAYLCFYDFLFIKPVQSLDGKSAEVNATVIDEPQSYGEYGSLLVKTTSHIDNAKAGTKLKIIIKTTDPVFGAKIGDIISFDADFSLDTSEFANYSKSQNIYISTFVENVGITGHKYTLLETVYNIKNHVRTVIRRELDGDTAELINGVILGADEQISPSLYTAFKECGVVHITSVSGVHIGIICSAFISVLSLFVTRRKAALLTVLPMIAVIGITGFEPSAIRAGIMAIFVFVGGSLLKRSDSLNSIGIAVFLMLIYNPFYILDLGFLLSCTATAGVVIASNITNPYLKKIHFKSKVLTNVLNVATLIFAQSVGASVFTLPIQIVHFGALSLISPIANILIYSSVEYMLLFTIAAVIIDIIPFVGIVAKPLFWIAGLMSKYTATVVTILSKTSFSYIAFSGSNTLIWIALSLSLVGLWLLFDKVGGKRFIIILVVALLIISLWSQFFASVI